jgi:hypothetical protein
VDQEESDEQPHDATGSATRPARKEKAREAAEDGDEHKGLYAQAKSCLLRPAVAGGLLGIGGFSLPCFPGLGVC